MIQVFTNPWLVDFLTVCNALSEQERKQYEEFSGEKYDAEQAAVGAFSIQGPKWVIKADEQPIAVGGFWFKRPGVWREFLFATPQAWSEHGFAVTRICRRAMDGMMLSKTAHRLECVALASKEPVFRWYRLLGYNREATLYGYCSSGADAVLFSRVSKA